MDYPKTRRNIVVEHDGWPKNSKSREIVRGQRQGRPRAKVRKGCFSRKRGTFQIAESDFLGMHSSKVVKSSVFHGRGILFEERSSPMSLKPKPEAKKSGSHK